MQFRGKQFDYDVATSGNKTDVIAEYVKACKKYGPVARPVLVPARFPQQLRAAAARNGTAGKLPDDFYRLAQDQLAELIKLYPEVGYYWLDVPRAASAAQRRVLYDMIKRLRPGTIVLFNNHAGTIEACQHWRGRPTC